MSEDYGVTIVDNLSRRPCPEISEKTGTEFGYLDDPRKEQKQGNPRAVNKGHCSLGFEPIKLEEGL